MLRRDLHTLFDRWQWTLQHSDGSSYQIILSDAIRCSTHYAHTIPSNPIELPHVNPDYTRWHHDQFKRKQEIRRE
jgi:hypothetical protein